MQEAMEARCRAAAGEGAEAPGPSADTMSFGHTFGLGLSASWAPGEAGGLGGHGGLGGLGGLAANRDSLFSDRHSLLSRPPSSGGLPMGAGAHGSGRHTSRRPLSLALANDHGMLLHGLSLSLSLSLSLYV